MEGLAYNKDAIINSTKQEYWVMIGDSYSAHHDDDRGDSWMEYLVRYLGVNYIWNTGTVTKDTNCWCVARGGMGFCGNSSNGPWITWMKNNYPSGFDGQKVTKIVIAGGFNDQYDDDATLGAAIREFDEYVQTTFPNAHVYCAFVGMTINSTSVAAALSRARNTYSNYIAELPRWTYMTGMEGALHNPLNVITTDYHHPTRWASRIIAKGIKNYLSGCSVEPISATADLTLYSGENYTVTSDTPTSIVSGINGFDDYMEIVNGGVFDITPSIALSASTQLLGTLSNCYYTNSTSRAAKVYARCLNTSGNWVDMWLNIAVSYSTGGLAVWRSTNQGLPAGPYTKIILPLGQRFYKNIYID